MGGTVSEFKVEILEYLQSIHPDRRDVNAIHKHLYNNAFDPNGHPLYVHDSPGIEERLTKALKELDANGQIKTENEEQDGYTKPKYKWVRPERSTGRRAEFERAILRGLKLRYPKWWSEDGMYMHCFNVEGEDGRRLIHSIGPDENVEPAIKNLLRHGFIEERKRDEPYHEHTIYRYLPTNN